MKCSDVIECSFPSWYKAFEDVTEKSIILPLPEQFLSYLHTDGLVLPESSTHGVYTKASNLAMDGDEDDKDLRDDDLMKMYEADWSTPDNTKVAQAPDLSDFDKEVTEAIKRLGGRVFPKLNWSSPKDANWIAFDRTLLCTCPSDIYLLLKSSEFIAHDLDQPFNHCKDEDDASPKPEVQYSLVLRKWNPPDPSTEFRAFVKNKKLIGICQRDHRKFYRHIKEDKEGILRDIGKFFKGRVLPRFQLDSYVFDVIRAKRNSVQLTDFNPYGGVTDSLMFSWEDLTKLALAELESPEFRCVEKEDGMKAAEYGNYALPKDIQDLTAGEDPYKMMDLLKLRAKQGNFSDSSSDEEEEEAKAEDSEVKAAETKSDKT